MWRSIGLADRPSFSDGRHLIIYGQRTADGRLAFGGRGAPYHFGSRIRPSYDAEPRVFEELRTVLREMLPQLRGRASSPTSGAAASASPATGPPRSGWTGAPGSAGRAGTSATGSPPPTSPGAPSPTWSPGPTATWSPSRGSNHRSRPWEPEPLRWLGINAGLRAMTFADVEERLDRAPERDRAADGAADRRPLSAATRRPTGQLADRGTSAPRYRATACIASGRHGQSGRQR